MDGYHEPDLFGEPIPEAVEHLTYPDRPGFKGTAETGREAAEAIAPKLGRLQRLVLDLVTQRGAQGITPEEASDLTGEDRVSLQPRFSELRAKGRIIDSLQRRTNPSSRKRAVVWVLTEYGPKAEESER
jgi:hypothetical protein